MKNILLLISFAVVSLNPCLSQVDSLSSNSLTTELSERLEKVESELEYREIVFESLQNDISALSGRITSLTESNDLKSIQIDSLNKQIVDLKALIASLSSNLETKSNEVVELVNQEQAEDNAEISKLNSRVDETNLKWLAGVVVSLVVIVLIFLLLRQKLSKTKSKLDENLEQTRRELQEEAIRLDEKLVEIMESQMKIMEMERANAAAPSEIDHTLALKVADEIIRIEKNLRGMDQDTKGLKQLFRAVERIRNDFNAFDYEIVDMLGKTYDDRMMATTEFITSEDLQSGERIITKIIRPQINFKGEMIQTAHIQVSQGV